MSVGEPSETLAARASRRDVGPAVGVGGLARVLGIASSALLGAALPVAMVVANKSAPAVLGAAALAATAAAILAGRGGELGRRYRAISRSPVAILCGAIVLLCLASFTWTIDVGLTRRGLVEGLPELVFALMAATAWPLVAGRRDGGWLVGGILLAGALILFEHLAGMPLHTLARARGEAWDLKRSAMPPLLLLWPAVVPLVVSRRWGLAGALLGAVAVGIAASHSGAPAAALAAGLALFVGAMAIPRTTLAVMAVVLALLVVTAPWTGSVLGRVLPSDTTEVLREEHAAHRLAIWNAFEARGFDRPALGHGFDASFAVGAHPRPGGAAPPPDSAEIVEFHPHDVMLQFWIEFGALGLAAAASVLGFVLDRLHRRRGPALAARLGLLASVLGIGLVGLSAWQPWWLASIAAALLWFDYGDRQAEA